MSEKRHGYEATGDGLYIRRYEQEDREAVLELHEAGLRQTGSFVGNQALDADLLDIEAAYPGSGGEFLVGELDGRVVAMGALLRTGPRQAEVKRMRVERGCQGRGYGRAMLEALHRRAAELGRTTLRLDTGTEQRAARALYERSGWYCRTGSGPVGTLPSVFYEKSLVV